MAANKDQETLDYVKRSVLQPNEKVVWKGRPNPLTYATLAAALFHCLFGIFFLGFAIFWTVGASQHGASGLFGLPFVAVGAWMVSGPLRIYLRAKRTYYAVTSQRILIVTAGNSMTVSTIYPRQIDNYERTDKVDGSGSIRLKETVSEGRKGITTSVEFYDGLWGIADVKGAADAIADLQTAN